MIAADAHLRRAVRALAGLDDAALDAVAPDAMRAVMAARGWTFACALPWFADRTVTAFEAWEHPTAHGEGCRGSGPWAAPSVRVCVLAGIDADETRHGDVAPAEVLAEALAWAAGGAA